MGDFISFCFVLSMNGGIENRSIKLLLGENLVISIGEEKGDKAKRGIEVVYREFIFSKSTGIKRMFYLRE